MLRARVTFSRSQIRCYVTIYAICQKCETTSNKTRVSPKHKARVNANMRLVLSLILKGETTYVFPDPECTFFYFLYYFALFFVVCCCWIFAFLVFPFLGVGGSITYSSGSEFIWHDASNMHMHF